jgi:hypothetical protein
VIGDSSAIFVAVFGHTRIDHPRHALLVPLAQLCIKFEFIISIHHFSTIIAADHLLFKLFDIVRLSP